MERYSYLQTMPNSPLTPLTPLNENTSFDFNFGGDGSLDAYIDEVRQKHRLEQQQQQLLATIQKQHEIQQQLSKTSPNKTRKDSPIRPKQRYSERFRKIRDVFENQTNKSTVEAVPRSRLRLKEVPKKLNCCHQQQQQQKCDIQKQQQQHQTTTAPSSMMHNQNCPIIKIVHADATSNISQNLPQDYVATPTNVRTPLKQRNHNIILPVAQKMSQQQLQDHQQRLKLLQQKSLAVLQPNRRLSNSNTTILQQQQQHQHLPPNNHNNQRHQQQQQHHHQFRQASPVALKPLCPNISKILHQHGLSMYCGVFQREEIDLFTFKMLTLKDLQHMGISNTKHCDILMAEICYAQQYY